MLALIKIHFSKNILAAIFSFKHAFENFKQDFSVGILTPPLGCFICFNTISSLKAPKSPSVGKEGPGQTQQKQKKTKETVQPTGSCLFSRHSTT